MQINPVTTHDVPHWEAISHEYDGYVMELVGDLKEWYEGGDGSAAFTAYMESKIAKKEAFMAIDPDFNCLGVVAVSKLRNRITFFGVSANANFDEVGSALLSSALAHLDTSRSIHINEIASQSEWIKRHERLYASFGFALAGNGYENGTPVNIFAKMPSVRP